VRDNTADSSQIRWDVLKSMLDDFPQLRARAEQYILEKKNSTQTGQSDCMDISVKEQLEKAVHEFSLERSRK